MRRRYYVLWLVGMGLAEGGAAFDVSWHFGHLFDEFSPPHMTVAVGVALMVALLVWALAPGANRVIGVERAALKVAAIALTIGILDEPLDLLWHLTFGVDITLWSPTHLMLNYPADVINIAVLTAFLASQASRARGAWLIVVALCLRNVMTTHFALYQQEYGAVALDSLTRTGTAPWYVEPALWALAGPRASQLVTGGVPPWLYLIYAAFAISYAFMFCAVVLHGRPGPTGKRLADIWPMPTGAATALAVCFILWRVAYRQLFLARHMAYGVIPWYFVPMGLVFDLTLLLGPYVSPRIAEVVPPRLRAHVHQILAGAAGVVAAVALFGGMQLMRETHAVVPAAPLAVLPFACLTGAIGAILGSSLAVWVRDRSYRRSVVTPGTPRRTRAPELPQRAAPDLTIQHLERV
ncbi:MAG TPA: hypothetical protein VF818_10430 [Ktedonobacterales bacterium]